MNPFRYGQVVSARDFCPRPELMKRLAEYIRSNQNVVLQGRRRMGKTSLIYEAVRRQKKLRMLHLDLMQIKTVNDLCHRLAKAIFYIERRNGFLEKILSSLAHLRPVVGVDPMTGSPTVSFDASHQLTPDSIEGLLGLVEKIGKKHSLVVFVDEFQDILNIKDAQAVLAILRSKIQFHSHIPYLYAGSVRNKMYDIFNDSDSAFFKSALPMEVGPLPDEAFAEFLSRKFSTGKRSIKPKTLYHIFDLVDRTAGDIQAMCAALWDTTSYTDTIGDKHITGALEHIHAQEGKGYETTLSQLTGQQVQCLVGLAKAGGGSPFSKEFLDVSGIRQPGSVKKNITRLTKLRIIYKHKNQYRFTNPFFRHWLILKGF